MHDDFYQMYLEELSLITPCAKEEEEELLRKLGAGEGSSGKAGKRLIEGNLHRALELAKEYAGQGLLLTDLVQEANMALTLAVGEWQGGAFDEYTEQKMRGALEEAVRSQSEQKKAGEEVAARVNVLQEVSKVMAAELGREATVDELAGRMKMTADEIREIMKITMNALSVHVEDGGQDEDLSDSSRTD